MVAPSAAVRSGTYLRDERCVRCGRADMPTYQHRKAGGYRRPPGFEDGLLACWLCNENFERSGQTEAYRYGWKLKGNADPLAVPVWVAWRRMWVVLDTSGWYLPIPPSEAHEMLLSEYGDLYTGWREELTR